MAITELPRTTPREDPGSDPPTPASAPPEPVSEAPTAVSGPDDEVSAAAADTPADDAGRPADRGLFGRLSGAKRATIGTLVAAALALAGIGLYLSFEHVAAFAHRELAFQTLGKAQMFVAGVDVGILVLIGLDLTLAWMRRPNRRIRYLVWLLTAATIVFNAASAAPQPGQGWKLLDYVAVGAHGLVPVLFIAVVEIGRGVIEQAVHPDRADTPSAAVPLHRWLLAPTSTARIYRRMRLWNAPSYQEVIREEQERTVYRSMLAREHGRWRKAPKDLQLPLRLAKFGLSVDEALAQPAEHKRRMADWEAQYQALELEEQERERLRQEAEAERLADWVMREAERSAKLQKARMKAAGSVETARHEVEAEASTAQRTAQLEAEAIETAALAEARARKAAAEAEEAEARKAAAQADRQRAEEELEAAKLRAEADKAEKIAQAELQAIETAQIAEARAREAAADRQKAKEELEAAKLRRQAAEEDKAAKAETRAVETAKAAEARQRAAEADAAAAETRLAAAETRRRAIEAEEAAARAEEEKKAAARRAAEAEEAAAEALRRAAETRLAVAEIERRAAEIEDEAKLTPRERAIRKVARMALTAGLTVDGLELDEIHRRLCELVSLADVQRELSVSSPGTASEYRQKAAELLAGGYRLPA